MMETPRRARCVSRPRLGVVLAGGVIAVAGFVPTPGASRATNNLDPADRTASATGSRASDTIPAPAQLTWRPEQPTQGTLVVVRITPAPGTVLNTVSGRGGGEDLHFYAVDGGAMESLVPVPVDASGSVQVAVTLQDASGSSRALEASIPVDPGSFHHEKLEVAPELGSPLSKANAARLARDQAKAREVSREAEQSSRLWTHRVVLPRKSRVTGGFGDGRIFNGQVSSRHLGLDLNGAVGDTVVATTRGVVALVDRFLLAGNIVYVSHGAGLVSGYFHLSKQLVAVGDTVEAGTPIGLVGATGRVTGPHLHWVVRYGTTSVNPESLIPALAGR
ncbi:MAG: M23 family metallopeptidase [Gemmatimonadetes bacterium]|nr:M23 family metallopeptidase [Gemmatimonadota bacterium]